ncbi:hypothetical protein GCM10020255_098240 [Rhodococcus baikonurensis]
MSVHAEVESRSAALQDSAHVGTDWRRAYRKRIAVSDSITVLFVIALAQIGSMWPHPIEWLTPLKVIASAALGGLWMIALARGVVVIRRCWVKAVTSTRRCCSLPARCSG